MLKTIETLNTWAREEGITEVYPPSLMTPFVSLTDPLPQPSLLNFCVTDGHTVVATRYISSKKDEAASLVRCSSCLAL